MNPCAKDEPKESLKGPAPKCTGNTAVDELLYKARIKDVAQISTSKVYD